MKNLSIQLFVFLNTIFLNLCACSGLDSWSLTSDRSKKKIYPTLVIEGVKTNDKKTW